MFAHTDKSLQCTQRVALTVHAPQPVIIIPGVEAPGIVRVTFVSSSCGRERERDACDVIDIILKSRVIMHMITSTARRRVAASHSDSSAPVCSLAPESGLHEEDSRKRQGAWRMSDVIETRD